ncbi:MAG: signal peptidase I [bacterium]|nr:signal peptidase I [bacterium]
MSDGIEKPESEAIQGQVAKPKAWLAGLLAVLVPGLGHLYLGLYKQAAVVWISVVLLLNLAILLLASVNWGVFGPLLVAVLILLLWIIPLVHVIIRARQISILQLPFNSAIFIIIVVAWVFLAPFAVPLGTKYHAYTVPASSMEDALQVGDRFLADQSYYLTKTPQRGDVIVFVWPGDNVTKFVKRCVGLPGDTVSMVDKQLFINGRPEVTAATVKHVDANTQKSPDGIKPTRDNMEPFIIPDGYYYFLGDNRDNSSDSRFWGPVSSELILGKAVRIYWSSNFERIGMPVK